MQILEKEGHMSDDQTWAITRQVACGLNYLHDNNIGEHFYL